MPALQEMQEGVSHDPPAAVPEGRRPGRQSRYDSPHRAPMPGRAPLAFQTWERGAVIDIHFSAFCPGRGWRQWRRPQRGGIRGRIAAGEQNDIGSRAGSLLCSQMSSPRDARVRASFWRLLRPARTVKPSLVLNLSGRPEDRPLIFSPGFGGEIPVFDQLAPNLLQILDCLRRGGVIFQLLQIGQLGGIFLLLLGGNESAVFNSAHLLKYLAALAEGRKGPRRGVHAGARRYSNW